ELPAESREGRNFGMLPAQTRSNMSTNSFATITTTLLCGSTAAVLALSSPAIARGGGHHHGECGEHHMAYGCGYSDYAVHHHLGHHYFEDHHGSEYPQAVPYVRAPERTPPAPDVSQGPAEPK